MPRYHFHLRDGDQLERDNAGLEFASFEEAYLAGCEAVPQMMAGFAAMRRDPRGCAFEITDAAGQLLIDLPFSDLFVPKHTQPATEYAYDLQPETIALFKRLDDLSALTRQELAQLKKNNNQARASIELTRASSADIANGYMNRLMRTYEAFGLIDR